MEKELLQQIKRLKAYNMVLTLAVLSLFLLALKPFGKTKFEELDVERLNIIQPDGKLVAVLANPTHFPPSIVNGRVLDPNRKGRGLLFFNAEGEECGGYQFSGGKDGEQLLNFTMDQYKQDQVLKLISRDGRDEDGPYSLVGLSIEGRPTNYTLDQEDILRDSIDQIPDPTERKKARSWLYKSFKGINNSLWLGKLETDEAGLFLTDKNGKDRLVLYLDKNGNPKLEFYDSLGNSIKVLPEK